MIESRDSEFSSDEADTVVRTWLESALINKIQVRVLEAETGVGKTYIAQSFYDYLASQPTAVSGDSYWVPGLRPSWPPRQHSAVEALRKAVVPPESLRRPVNGGSLDFLWIGVPLSAELGSTQFDPAAQVLEQISRLYSAALILREEQVRRNSKKVVVKKTARGIAKHISGFFLPSFLIDVIGNANAIGQFWEQWRAAFANPSDVHHAEARSELLTMLNAIHEISETKDLLLVIALDDAHEATEGLLDILNFIIGIEPDDEQFGVFRWTPAHRLPVLVLATTWPGESKVRRGGLFDRWLAIFRAAKGNGSVITARIAPLKRSTASELLVRAGVPNDFIEPMTDHLASARGGVAVNPLVLANGRAAIERELSGAAFSPNLTMESIKRLPTAPDFYVRQRLERLGAAEPGATARELITQLAEWGTRVPGVTATKLAQFADPPIEIKPLLEILVHHRMIDPLAPPDQLEFRSLEADLRAHLTETNTYDVPIRAVAPLVRNYILDLIRDEHVGDAPLLEVDQIREVLLTSLRLNRETFRNDVDFALTWFYAVMPYRLGPSVRPQSINSPLDVPTAAETRIGRTPLWSFEERNQLWIVGLSGKSRASELAAQGLVHQLEEPWQSLELARFHSGDRQSVLALVINLPMFEAISLLLPHSGDDEVSQFIKRTTGNYFGGAERLLANFPELLDLIPDPNHTLHRTKKIWPDPPKLVELEAASKSSPWGAIRFATFLPDSDAIAVLSPFAEDPFAARDLALRLSDDEAVDVLKIHGLMWVDDIADRSHTYEQFRRSVPRDFDAADRIWSDRRRFSRDGLDMRRRPSMCFIQSVP